MFPFGNLYSVFCGHLGLGDCFKGLYEESYGAYIGLYMFKEPVLLIRDPELIRNILVKDFDYFCDRGIYKNEIREPTSGHLFKLTGKDWKHMRNKLNIAFTVGKMKLFLPLINDVAKNLNNFLFNQLDEKCYDIDDLSITFSADIIASTIFGIEINSFQDRDNKFIVMAKDLFVSKSYLRILKASMQLFYPNILKYIKIEEVKKEQNMFIYKLVKQIINFRESSHIFRQDLMQILIELKNNPSGYNNKRISFNEIVAQAYTFFFAGFETASSTISFLLYECALNEKIQENVYRDICEILRLYGEKLTYESIMKMKYLQLTIDETLRKYPILSFLNRIAVKNYQIPNTQDVITKGTRILISVSGLHYDKIYYRNPELFNPERGRPHPFTYLPFGEGHRNCIGKLMGKIMVSVGIITILKNYKVSICEKTDIPIKYNNLTYFTKNNKPIVLKLSRRSHFDK